MDRADSRRLLVEVLLEHLQCGRRRGRASVAAVLDQCADDELRIAVRPVTAPPRLVERPRIAVAWIEHLLGGAGLAGDLDREAAENRRRRPERIVRRLV